MKLHHLAYALIAFALLSTNPVAAKESRKVLIIASNMLDMGDPEKHEARNNLWEVAPPYHVFVSHGFEVDFASPRGGEVHFFMEPLGISSYTIKYEGFMDKANNSLAPDQINVDDYWGIYIGGGAGPVFDVAHDKGVQNLIAQLYESGAILGAGGHGSAGFANVKLSSGEYLVKGKRIAAFPDSTEKTKPWAKQGTLLPFLVESQLNKHGAIALNKETIADKRDVIIDQRIVSTMFLPSAALVAKEMILLNERMQNED